MANSLEKIKEFVEASGSDAIPRMARMLLVDKTITDINIKLKADVSILRAVKDVNDKPMVELLTKLGVKEDGCLEERCF